MLGTGEDPALTTTAGVPKRRRIRIAGAVLAMALAGAGIAVGVPWGQGGRSVSSKAEQKARTVKVVRTDLSDSRTLDGRLGYSKPQTVKGSGDGIVTWLASEGTTVTRGRALYRVDDREVPVFYGTVPLYRRIAGRNTVGRDVQVIVDNLRALGYDIGAQPPPGQVVSVTDPKDAAKDAAKEGSGPAGGTKDQDTTPSKPSSSPGTSPGTDSGASGDGSPDPQSSASGSDRDPAAEGTGTEGTGTEARKAAATAGTEQVRVKSGDGVLTPALESAIKRWQTSRGVRATGVIEPGDVAVLRGAVRVDGASAQVGDPASEPLLRVTSTDKAVTVPVDASERGSVTRGDPVTVQLPDGTSAAGRVAGVGTHADADEEDRPGEPKVTVTVSLTDPDKVKKLDSGPVQVDFVSESRDGVLAVPVTALLALREGGYGVQIAGGRVVAVETGLIAKGMAEVTGDGIAEGTRVVAPS
ncbi:peptidoglycan-binding protein [Streptomyces cucumeris]|uniref:peptidoglycan-binding protein n=1 Tax=Streptomyces cucumeris TaxID=2962890 RepID=UPI0020C8FBD7|nr:peptidoglycan-binding protein [Streptomyces sp. NEAU-Y11]MCP9209754.1 peptidoglycan-binding protein [Streptomyces sp. NEAU-Y11]